MRQPSVSGAILGPRAAMVGLAALLALLSALVVMQIPAGPAEAEEKSSEPAASKIESRASGRVYCRIPSAGVRACNPSFVVKSGQRVFIRNVRNNGRGVDVLLRSVGSNTARGRVVNLADGEKDFAWRNPFTKAKRVYAQAGSKSVGSFRTPLYINNN